MLSSGGEEHVMQDRTVSIRRDEKDRVSAGGFLSQRKRQAPRRVVGVQFQDKRLLGSDRSGKQDKCSTRRPRFVIQFSERNAANLERRMNMRMSTFSKKYVFLLGILVLLTMCAPLGASQELRLELAPDALEKLGSVEGTLFLEWGYYRNT